MGPRSSRLASATGGGVEALSGIRAASGRPIQNVGAYGQEVADVIVGVRALDRLSGEVHDLDPEACLFDYRSSVFKRDPGRWLVLRVSFALERTALSEPVRYAELAARLRVDEGARAPIAEVREAVLTLRRGKGMVLDADESTPSARARSSRTDPAGERLRGVRAGAASASARRAAAGMAGPAGRGKTSAAWLIEAPASRAARQPGRDRDLFEAHARALQPRRRDDRALVAPRADRGAVRETFGVELVPEPVFRRALLGAIGAVYVTSRRPSSSMFRRRARDRGRQNVARPAGSARPRRSPAPRDGATAAGVAAASATRSRSLRGVLGALASG